MSVSQPEMDLLENQEFQRKSWRLQRWSWFLLGLFLAAAALGFTGSAWLTRKKAEAPAGGVDWPRFARQGATFEIDVRLERGSAFWVSHDFLDAFELVTTVPRAAAESADRERVHFRTAAAPSRVRLFLKPLGAGWVRGEFGLDGDVLAVSQFVFY